MTPLARSLALLRRQGWLGDPVERWMPAYRKGSDGQVRQLPYGTRKDWLGFADALLFRRLDGSDPASTEWLALQATSGANVNAHLKHLAGLAEVRAFLACPGHRLCVHGWRKPSKTLRTWRLREEEITLARLEEQR